MRSPCDPPKFDEQDWSQFDFSRWHLDGVQLDNTAAAIAELANRLFTSQEWNDNFKAGLPEIQKQAMALYQQNTTDLQAEKTATAAEFEQRIKAARDQGAAVSQDNEAVAAPLIVPATPDSYHAVVKVMDSSGRLGLPGLTVQLMDPRDPDVPLGQTQTDAAGNAVLSITADTAKELDSLHTAFRVADLSGQVLQKISDGACIRLNQTETKIIPLADVPEIQSSKDSAAAARTQREANIQRVATKVELLQQERDSRLKSLDCRIKQNQAIIDSIQSPPTGPATTPAGQQSGGGTSTGTSAAQSSGRQSGAEKAPDNGPPSSPGTPAAAASPAKGDQPTSKPSAKSSSARSAGSESRPGAKKGTRSKS